MSLGIADVYTSSLQNDEAAVALVARALDLEVTFLDTADIYGDSELKVGTADPTWTVGGRSINCAIVADGSRAISLSARDTSMRRRNQSSLSARRRNSSGTDRTARTAEP